MVLIEGRAGAFESPTTLYGRFTDNIYDVLRPRYDSLFRAHPDAFCTTRNPRRAERVDCLRMPVHVNDRIVWTDSTGRFTAGPFLEGTEVKLWIDESRLPRFHAGPGGKSNCLVNGHQSPHAQGHTYPPVLLACYPSSLLNYQHGRRFQEGHDGAKDTVTVTVTAGRDTVAIPIWSTITVFIRLPEPGMKLRLWDKRYYVSVGKVRWDAYHEGKADWNGEVVVREVEHPQVWSLHSGYPNFVLQMPNPSRPGTDLCVVTVPFESWPNHIGQRYIDYSDPDRDVSPGWSDCVTHIPFNPGDDWRPPPLNP